ncbi:hypothetical protein O9K63_14900 [Janibacter cremeus]|uniref:hypothetical protein n=1 Tax=Janibacter cremeus TaxID=1285192 RepID=UPI0023F86274|nr:hypothetical protein [Janibacter cremeus]WEV77862.1 hypothetical protein O9K63_14900 [Janibacter cremeus]
MGERWLYGVDGGLLEPDDEWGRDPWLDGVPPSRDAGRVPDGLGTVTEVVLIDGHVVDSVTRPVSGSGYECAALELAHLREPAPPPRVERVIVREEPQEQMLHWLERVVGSKEALDTLDDDPLPLGEPLEPDLLPLGSRDLACAVDEHLDLLEPAPILSGQLITAYRRLLATAAHAGMLHLWRDFPPTKVTATIVHTVVKANALTGTGAPFSYGTFVRGLGEGTAPSARSRSLALLVGGSQWPHGRSPSEAPGVYVLGDTGLLVSRFRNELITYRDLARTAEAALGQVAAG